MDCMASRYPFFFNAASFFPSPLFQEPSFPVLPSLPSSFFSSFRPISVFFCRRPTDARIAVSGVGCRGAQARARAVRWIEREKREEETKQKKRGRMPEKMAKR